MRFSLVAAAFAVVCLIGCSSDNRSVPNVPEGFFATGSTTENFPLGATKRVNGTLRVYYVYQYSCDKLPGARSFGSDDLIASLIVQSTDGTNICGVGVSFVPIDNDSIRGDLLNHEGTPTGRTTTFRRITAEDFLQRFRAYGFATGGGRGSDSQEKFCQELYAKDCSTLLGR